MGKPILIQIFMRKLFFHFIGWNHPEKVLSFSWQILERHLCRVRKKNFGKYKKWHFLCAQRDCWIFFCFRNFSIKSDRFAEQKTIEKTNEEKNTELFMLYIHTYIYIDIYIKRKRKKRLEQRKLGYSRTSPKLLGMIRVRVG